MPSSLENDHLVIINSVEVNRLFGKNMKLVQKRFGASVIFEIVGGDLIIASKGFGTKGRAKIPLAFVPDEYSEHQERSRGWIVLAVFAGVLSIACIVAGLFVEKQVQRVPFGIAIMFGLVAALSVRSHIKRNIDGIMFVRTDTSSVVFMYRDLPSRDEFESFVSDLIFAIRERKKKPNQ